MSKRTDDIIVTVGYTRKFVGRWGIHILHLFRAGVSRTNKDVGIIIMMSSSKFATRVQCQYSVKCLRAAEPQPHLQGG